MPLLRQYRAFGFNQQRCSPPFSCRVQQCAELCTLPELFREFSGKRSLHRLPKYLGILQRFSKLRLHAFCFRILLHPST